MTKKLALLLFLGCFLAFAIQPETRSSEESAFAAETPWRPVALSLMDDGKVLLVANRDRGSVCVVDCEGGKTLAEMRVGGKLSDLAVSAHGGMVAATDEEKGEVILLNYAERNLREKRRVKVGLSPVSVRFREDGKIVSVALLWPRQIALVALSSDNAVSLVDLPFAPRLQVYVPGTAKLIVADSFGAHLAVIDTKTRTIDRVCAITTVHNIRGLAIDHTGKYVLLAHQRLHASGHPTRGDIQSGNLIDNEFRKLLIADLLNPLADPLRGDRVHPLGDIDRGAGDPAEIAETKDGKTVVAFAGVNELAIGYPAKATWKRLNVGKRPTRFAIDAKRNCVYVANTFGDSISVVDLAELKVKRTISLSAKPASLDATQRGELLFHDATLSFDGWYSCHSCHTDGHTNGRLNDNLTDGSFGTPKRVLTLLGVKDTAPYAWHGKIADAPSQITQSLTSTMQGPTPTKELVNDIAAYLMTLAPPPPVTKARGKFDAKKFEQGRAVFVEKKCASCHKEPTFTSQRTYDVGLRDEAGLTQFNPPSLRGISQAGPYFHDGRARSLDEVFSKHRHPGGMELRAEERAALLEFLDGL